MPEPRLAGQRLGFARALPFVGDLIGAGLELSDPDASPNQRLVNAGITTGGGILSSIATGGLDLIPQVVDTVNQMIGGPKGPEKLRQMQACATVANADRHFGSFASWVGPDKYNKFYETEFPRAAQQCGESIIPPQLETEEEKSQYLQLIKSGMGRMF